MSSIPNINLDNASNVLSQELLVKLLPYVYVVISIVSIICLLLVYICVMVTLNNRKLKSNTVR